MKLVTDLFDTDMPNRPPFSLFQELQDLEQDYLNNKPVIHQLKQLIDQYPAIPDPACFLAKVYANQGKGLLSEQLLNDLRQRFPDSPLVLTTVATVCLNYDVFDELDRLGNLNLSFQQQFPARKLVEAKEWFHYEEVSLHWMLSNEDFEEAYERIQSILKLLEGVPYEPSYYYILWELLEEWVYPEDSTPAFRDLQELLQKKNMAGLYHPHPPFRHPETSILLRPLVQEDIPLLLQLLKLPKASLLPDLRQAIRDTYFNDAYYRETTEPEYSPDLALVGFTLLVALDTDPGIAGNPDRVGNADRVGNPAQASQDTSDSLYDWLDFLHKPGDFIDFWLGDFLNEFCFLFSWKLGRNQLPQMEAALREPFRHEWAPVCLATGLVLTALKEPEKKTEVLDIFERTLVYWLNQPREENPEHLIATLLEYGVVTDENRFLPLLQQAWKEKRVDPKIYGASVEKFMEESAYFLEEDSIEMSRSTMSLQEQLEFFFQETSFPTYDL